MSDSTPAVEHTQHITEPATEPLPYTGGGPLLLLASASAGRRATLTAARIEHDTLPVDLDEDAILDRARSAAGEAGAPLAAAEEVLLLAREKAQAATELSDGGYVVLGGDSMLELDGTVLGKPRTAQAAGLSEDQFNQCITDRDAIAAMDQRIQAARAQGVTGTPAFYVNDKQVVTPGGQGASLADLSAAIDAELTK